MKRVCNVPHYWVLGGYGWVHGAEITKQTQLLTETKNNLMKIINFIFFLELIFSFFLYFCTTITSVLSCELIVRSLLKSYKNPITPSPSFLKKTHSHKIGNDKNWQVLVNKQFFK